MPSGINAENSVPDYVRDIAAPFDAFRPFHTSPTAAEPPPKATSLDPEDPFSNTMCHKSTCGKCSKPTWVGCGRHIDSVSTRQPRNAADRPCPKSWDAFSKPPRRSAQRAGIAACVPLPRQCLLSCQTHETAACVPARLTPVLASAGPAGRPGRPALQVQELHPGRARRLWGWLVSA